MREAVADQMTFIPEEAPRMGETQSPCKKWSWSGELPHQTILSPGTQFWRGGIQDGAELERASLNFKAQREARGVIEEEVRDCCQVATFRAGYSETPARGAPCTGCYVE